MRLKMLYFEQYSNFYSLEIEELSTMEIPILIKKEMRRMCRIVQYSFDVAKTFL